MSTPSAPNIPSSPKLPKKPFLTPAKLERLKSWGRKSVAFVLTFGGILADNDLRKGEFFKANWAKTKADLHTTVDQWGVRSMFEPLYLWVSAPETVTQTVDFESPQIYARKFDVGASIDSLDHQELVHMISSWLSTYMLSQIYGEGFLEEDYLGDSNQRSFQYRIHRVTFKASSSPEALLHGLASVMIWNIDTENIELARIRLAKFKAALREACAQLHIDLAAAERDETVQEKQLTPEEEQELTRVAHRYPWGGEALLTAYNRYCEDLQKWVETPAASISADILEVLNRIIGSKRTVWCEVEFSTEKWHVFLIPFYRMGLLLLWPELRRIFRRKSNPQTWPRDGESPQDRLKRFKIPNSLDKIWFVKRKKWQTREETGEILKYKFPQERRLLDIIMLEVHRREEWAIDLLALDQMHRGNLDFDIYDPSPYLAWLELPDAVRARILRDAREWRGLNILMYILIDLKKHKKTLPSQEVLMNWIHTFYLQYEKIEPYAWDEEDEIALAAELDQEDVHSAVDEASDAISDEALIHMKWEDRTSVSRKQRTSKALHSVLAGTYIEIEAGEKNKKHYDPKKKGNPGRVVRPQQHDQQYNKFRGDNHAKGRYKPETWTGRGKNSRTGRGTRAMASNARSSQQNRHSPMKKK